MSSFNWLHGFVTETFLTVAKQDGLDANHENKPKVGHFNKQISNAHQTVGSRFDVRPREV